MATNFEASLSFGIHRQNYGSAQVLYSGSIQKCCIREILFLVLCGCGTIVNRACYIPNEACDLSKAWQIIIVGVRVEVIKSTLSIKIPYSRFYQNLRIASWFVEKK